MFNNKDFYPTPKEIIKKMTEGYSFDYNTKILEPSAGKGDIVKYIIENKHINLKNIHCIEKDYNLQQRLKDRNFVVISDNFLQYDGTYLYDFIIMNPPFANAEEHLLKALEIGSGAEIICLLPAGVLEANHSQKRQLLQKKLEELGADIEDLGTPFENAERKTKVRTYLIKVTSEKKESLNFDFKIKNETKSTVFDFNVGQQLINQNNADEIFIRYNKRIEIFKKILLLSSELDFYSDTENLMAEALNTSKKNIERYNKYITDLKEGYWKTILDSFDIDYLLTEAVRKEWDKLRLTQFNMEFSKENVKNFILELKNKESEIINQCILASFDLLTKFNVKNSSVMQSSKFKTNSEYKINVKNIIPYVIGQFRNDYGWIDKNYHIINKIKDIERGICFISKNDFRNITSCTDDKFFNKDEFGNWQDSTFFKLKLFKKGTMHLKWKNEELLQKFNLKVNQLRADLPNKK